MRHIAFAVGERKGSYFAHGTLGPSNRGGTLHVFCVGRCVWVVAIGRTIKEG